MVLSNCVLLRWMVFLVSLTLKTEVLALTSDILESKRGAGLCNLFWTLKSCEPMKCYWSDWKNRNITSNKIVLGYLHNGLGNQLYQSSFSFGVAGALGAKVYLTRIEPSLHLPPGDTKMPPNTESAYELIQEIIPEVFSYDLLPEDSHVKRLCNTEPYYLSDRPYEMRRGALNVASLHKLEALLSDPEPRCIRLCGYWQGPKVCWADAKEIWSLDKAVDNMGNVSLDSIKSGKYNNEKAVNTLEAFRHEKENAAYGEGSGGLMHRYSGANGTYVHIRKDVLQKLLNNQALHTKFKSIINNQTLPGRNDMCVYMRCLPEHYYFNHELFYDMIFNNTHYNNIWVFESPHCRESSVNRRIVDPMLKYMYHTRHAKKFQTHLPYVDVSLKAREALLDNYGMSAEYLSRHFAADEELKVHVQADLKEAHHMFVDLYALTRCKKLVLPHSSWAIWAGTLSNAVEIHVNVPPYFALMDDTAYIYHDESSGNYWGSFNNKLNRFQYRFTGLPPIEPERRLWTSPMIDMDYDDAYT